MSVLDRLSNRAFALVLVALATLCFLPGLTSPLIHYDDSVYITGNPAIAAGGWAGFLDIWSSDRAWKGLFVEFFPLRDTFYWVTFQQFGTEGTPYHVWSLCFHALASVLVFRLVLKLDPARWVAMVAAALFAVHPLHIESVTWAASLKDPMFTSAMLGSILLYLRYRETQKPWRYAVSLLLLVTALLVKSLAIVTPLLLVALERLQDKPTPWAMVVKRVTGFALVAGLFTVQFVLIGKAMNIVGKPHGGSWMAHWVLTAWAQFQYLWQAFLPTSFDLIECYHPVTAWADARLFAGLGALALGVVTAWAWRKQPLRLLLVAWYFINLVPVSNLVPFPAVMADRYLYAPSVATVWLMASLLHQYGGRLMNVAAVIALVGLGLMTAHFTSLWHDEEALWAATDEDPACVQDPDFPAAQSHLIRAWVAQRPEDQLAAVQRALASPAYNEPKLEAVCDVLIVGIPVARRLGDQAKALEWSRRAIRACPQRAEGWAAAMIATIHLAPKLAATAAEQAALLQPRPDYLLFKALTALEVESTPVTQAAVEAAVRNPKTCEILATWRREVSPALVAATEGAARLCAERGTP